MLTNKTESKDSQIDPNQPLHFSNFSHQFQRNGLTALYYSLKHEVVFVKNDILKFLKPFNQPTAPLKMPLSQKCSQDMTLEDLIVALKDKKILIVDDQDDFQVIKKIREKILGKPSINILYLLLTDQCNLRCSYCYIESPMPHDHNFSMMTKETAKEGIELFVDCLKKNPKDIVTQEPTILFYGGEPLLNVPVFEFALEYIEDCQNRNKLPAESKINLITNGVLITEKVAQIVKKHDVNVSVSIDGWKSLHDVYRKTSNGKATFKQVIKKCALLKKYQIPISVSCTITPANVDYLPEIVAWLAGKFQIQGMGFNLMTGVFWQAIDNKKYMSKATEKLIEAFKVARQKGIYEDRIMRRGKPFIKGYPYLKDCGGYGNQIVVAPDGRIGVCQGYISSGKYFPGNVHSGFDPFSNPIFKEWSKRSPFNIKNCLRCEALGICGGSCAYDTDLKYGNIWAIDKNFCTHPKKLIEWFIWDLYEISDNKEV